MTASTRAVLLLAASAFVLAAPASGQSVPSSQTRSLAPSGGAAASLPNSFDAPAPAASAAPSMSAEATATAIADAEAALRIVIEQLKAGEIEPSLYTPGLAARLRAQLATIRPMLASYGALLTIEAQGTRDGSAQFLVTFEEAATQWMIGLDDAGLIAAVLFRPAPAESSEPAGAAE